MNNCKLGVICILILLKNMEQNVFKRQSNLCFKITVFIDIIYQEDNSLYRQ